MQFTDFNQLDVSRLPTPCFVVDEVAIERNLKILAEVAEKSGAKILHALKAFSMWSLAPLTNQYLQGTCSSGLHEALLAKEYYQDAHANQEIHVYSAGFSQQDLTKLLEFADHIVFNSPTQLLRFADMCFEAKQTRAQQNRAIHFGLRINPEHSEGTVPLYDPCAPCSRLGTTRKQLDIFLNDKNNHAFQKAFSLISGLHFHTLCEQNFLPLQRTLEAVEDKFGDLLVNMQWLNMGGGHHITAPSYQLDGLINCIKTTQKKYDLQVYLEPGEAVAMGTGVLVSEVLDVFDNNMPHAILDTSATCHMPDTLEMPYRAEVFDAGMANEKPYTYRLGGLTCLAGDVMNDYSFDKPLQIGQRLVFEDMAHYTMVKTNTFNGTKLPALVLWHSKKDTLTVIKTFGYEDFKQRLS